VRVKLLAAHVINDRLWPTSSELEVTLVTPLMEPLDAEASTAIAAEKLRVFGRWRWDNGWHLIDDPPIERPLADPQPVEPVGGEGGPG
jgi:hypothetical protein